MERSHSTKRLMPRLPASSVARLIPTLVCLLLGSPIAPAKSPAQKTVSTKKTEPTLDPGQLPLHARGAIVVDAHSGESLYEKNADQPQYPASTTKIMVDTKSNNSMIYLPLDKLIAQTAAEAAAGVAPPTPTTPPPSVLNESAASEGKLDRNRERSMRDRESR